MTYFRKLSSTIYNKTSKQFNTNTKYKILFWIGGLFAFLWIILRSGTNPKRLAYPCQKAAFPLASAWFIAIAGIIGGTVLWKLIARIGVAAVLVLGLGWFMISASSNTIMLATTSSGLPVWEVSNPVSEVFVLDNIPTTPGSLNAGDASVPDSYLPDPAIDSLFMIMDSQSLNIYNTASTPNGLVSADETVIIKGNFQWSETLSTNTDRIKGLIWKILQHPDGFTGEILVCENHQNAGVHDLTQCNNSEDLNQTILDVISTFKAKGYPVDLVLWSEFNDVVVTEYSDGNYTDGYTWNETSMVTYPKFTTPAGTYVSLKYGIWNNSSSSYNRDNLCVINFPVAKAHGWVGATIGIKNWLGTLSAAHTDRYGGSDAMHCNYWFSEIALPARVMAEATPDLTIVDATWVAPQDNYTASSNNRTRMNMLVASTDPVASSYYTAKYILNPIADSDRRTDPDNTDNSGTCAGFTIPYSVVFSNWTNYLINTAGMNYTRDTLEMSVYSRESLSNTPVSNITVSSDGGVTSITTLGGTLQLHAQITPEDATNKSVTWSINNTSIASISPGGLLTAIDDGSVIATATANDGSGVYGEITITLSNQNPIPVSSINVSSEGNVTEITIGGGTLQFYANVLPADATNKTITWSTSNPVIASINQSGLLTALDDGNVTIYAASNDGSGITGQMTISISNQNTIPVTYITLNSEGNSTEIDTDGGTLQLFSQVLPEDATNKAVEWSVDATEIASIDQNGLLQAINDGFVTATATAIDGSGIFGSMGITISNQNLIPVSSIVISSEGNATIIDGDGGTLQMYATVLPSDASDKSITWNVDNLSIAGINSNGLLTAYNNGTVSVTAVANDGSGVSQNMEITISNQNPIPVTDITINSEGDETTINTKDGTLQLYSTVLPETATNKTVSWSVNNAYIASISNDGLLTAIDDGTVNAIASANDGSGISESFEIVISNQNPILVSSISIYSETGASTITSDGSTLQLFADVLPANASDNSVTWSVDAPTIAGISQNGMMIAYDNGTVTATATANDGSGVTDDFVVVISNQNLISVSDINITSENNISEIDTKNGQLQLFADILPANATNKSITWSVNNQAIAFISQAGLLTAYHNGEVIASAHAEDGSGVFGTISINLINQDYIEVEEIVVYTENNESIINQANGQLQLLAYISPQNATNTDVAWSVSNEDIAIINSEGLLSAKLDGDVTAYAISVDNPEIIDSMNIEIQNQTAVFETGHKDNFLIYPIPSKEKIHIQNRLIGETQYSLSDINGREIYYKKSAAEIVEFDITRLNDGIYLLKIIDSNQISTIRKIIVGH